MIFPTLDMAREEWNRQDALAAAQLAVVSAAMDETRAEDVLQRKRNGGYFLPLFMQQVDEATAARRLACEALAKIEEAKDAG